MNKPDIRFNGFNEEWTEKKYKEVFDTSVSNNTLSRAELTTEKTATKNVHYGDILIKYNSILDVKKDDFPFVPDEVKMDPRNFLKNGDIVFADTAEDETCGKATEINNLEHENVVAGLHTFVARPKNVFEEKYLGYFVNSPAYHNQLIPFMQGTKVTSISKSNIQKTTVKYPESAEQKKLGALFSQIDSLIASTQKEHEKLVALKKCMLQKMFPKKGSPVPEIRFKGFTGDWIQQKFGYILEELTERTTSDQEDVLLTSAIDGVFLNSEYFSHQRGQSTIGYKKIVKNTLILSAQNLHLGNANVNLKFEHGIISPAYNCYLLINCVPEFISAWVKRDSTKQFFFDATTVGASVCRRNVDWNLLYNQFLQIPTIEEQQKIGSYFQNLDNLISKQSAELEKLKNVKKTLLSKMFV